jgi:muramoyltetrapeptide carboxypeptidase
VAGEAAETAAQCILIRAGQMREPIKPHALQPGAQIYVASPASPADPARLQRGMEELARLGYSAPGHNNPSSARSYFARPLNDRVEELETALTRPEWGAVFCLRGGYGATYLLDRVDPSRWPWPKIVLGHSDISSLQIFLWQKRGWVTFYGPMVAAGFDAGADVAAGYDSESFLRAMTETRRGWSLDLQGATMVRGEAEGVLLGGCLTLVETTLATPWELDTDGAILLLEDRGMKPYQVDRALVHLRQAGKFRGVRGIVLGEFPDCAPPPGGEVTVLDVLQDVLGDIGVPLVWRAPIGHTTLPMLTVPLGVRARLHAADSPQLDILEPAVIS